MTYAEVIALINANITTNGNNEITGAILNSVLQAMLTQPNDLIGDLTDLNTDVSTDIVAAINWILTQLDAGAQIHSGIPDPNVTPPAEYSIGDLYSQTNVGLTPVSLWIYSGVSWVNLSGYLSDVLESPGVNVDKTIPATPKPWINDFNLFLNPSFENNTEEWSVPTGSLTFSFVTASIIASPNNKRAGKFDVGTSSVVKFSNSNSNTYEGKDGVFSFFFMSNTIVTVTVKSDADELISLEIPVTPNWRRFTLPFTADENLSIEISNDIGGSFWLDQMYFGLDNGSTGGDGVVYEEILHAAALALVSSNGVEEGLSYKITDRADLGIFLTGVKDNSFSLHAEGGFLNPDFQDEGNYSGVITITGIAKATNRGVWYADGESVYEDGDIVFWNGLHYQMTDMGAVDNTDPETNTDAYTVLPKSAENVGYIEEWDFVNYDINNDRLLLRCDRRQNKIEDTFLGGGISLFQFGNNNVLFNTVSNNSLIYCLNNRGDILYNNVSVSSSIEANTNYGEIRNNTINSHSDIIATNNIGQINSNCLSNASVVRLDDNEGIVISCFFASDNDTLCYTNKGNIVNCTFIGSYCTIELDATYSISTTFFKSVTFTANATENIVSQNYEGTTQSLKLVGTEVFAITNDEDYVQKRYVDTLQTAGNDITFARPRQFGTFTTPLTGALTNTLTGAVIGKIQKIYHQDSSLTVPGTWVLKAGTYNNGQKNEIYAEWIEGTRVDYWIINL